MPTTRRFGRCRERGAELVGERGLERDFARLGHSAEPRRREQGRRPVVEAECPATRLVVPNGTLGDLGAGGGPLLLAPAVLHRDEHTVDRDGHHHGAVRDLLPVAQSLLEAGAVVFPARGQGLRQPVSTRRCPTRRSRRPGRRCPAGPAPRRRTPLGQPRIVAGPPVRTSRSRSPGRGRAPRTAPSSCWWMHTPRAERLTAAHISMRNARATAGSSPADCLAPSRAGSFVGASGFSWYVHKRRGSKGVLLVRARRWPIPCVVVSGKERRGRL